MWYVPTPSEAIECVVDELPNRDKGEGQVTLRATSMKRTITCPASYITHERPTAGSGWRMMRPSPRPAYCHDRGLPCACDPDAATYVEAMARDLVRRAKALAERGQ